ncbi:kinesin-like protein KIF24 isoform X2 [Carcharodon carcharias]|uniref:kinesin-like protein KIF24 isoform X2 n=1 Tax=Carcharodon carcharias TaxID=13397 RepID=UPI001B7F0049|nr:kinesin-like protein KIF24 isoform X2 [Carcharodon carcharias]
MSSCLYECLCEAGLEQYYTHFTAMGFLKSQDLVKLTVNEYSVLGIHNTHDQKRLFQLIQIIKAVQEEEHGAGASTDCAQAGILNFFVEKVKPGPRRQLNFESLSNNKRDNVSQVSDPSSYPPLISCVNQLQDTASGLLKLPSPVDQLPAKLCLKDMHSLPEREHGRPTIFLPNSTRVCDSSEIQNTKMILHVSGYNYGLPHAVSRPVNPGKEQSWMEIEKIRVCVRKRPLGVREMRRGEIDVAKVEEKKSVLVHEKKEAVDLKQYLQQHVFYFDEAFEETCTNYDVYLKTAYPLIQHVFSGGMATCFAYGQTGAGKTHTMIGTDQNPGLYALAAEDIFMQLQTSEQDRAFFIWISFYEIYCGQLYDLLNGRKRLFAREDGNHTVQIVGLREIQVDGVQSLLEVISMGSKARSTGASGINTDSSRSHAIIQIQLKNPTDTIVGRISFIDLAGSERAADARDSDKQTRIEGAEINQSLLALKECIRALDQEHPHTPFRQSKLTLVLKDSFVGNSKTCMIANISPSHVATEHTLNTLRYADRVKELKRGTKTPSTIYTRSQGVRSPSPKRTKETPCKKWGEKSVQKNMKLRIEQSYCETKNTMQPISSSVFHPPNVLHCSTPKMLNKNALSQTSSKDLWLSHTTPIKGMLKKGSLDVKKNAKDKGSTDKSSITKERFLNNPKPGTSKRIQCGQRNNSIPENECSVLRNVKVQAVYPIQKEIISRNRFHFTDQVPKNYSPNKENNAECFENECHNSPESSVNIRFLQKERERHLRLYHQQLQQLQQSPLMQKKLGYQPLKELLGQLYQPKIRMDDEETKYISLLQCAAQRSDDQNECSSSCDSFSDYQYMLSRENQTDGNQDRFCEVSKRELSGRRNVQESLFPQNQHVSPRAEDSNKNSSPWNTGEDCIVTHSSESNSKQTAYSHNNIDCGQENSNHLSSDSKITPQNKKQECLSTYHQDNNAAASQHSQMSSNLSLAVDLKTTKAGDTTLFQSSRNIDSHLNAQSLLKRITKDEQTCNITNNVITSTDCISEDLLIVSDSHNSVERPPSKIPIPTDEAMTISCNQCTAEMEDSPACLCNKAEISSPPTVYFGNWVTVSHDFLDKNQKFSPAPLLDKKQPCRDLTSILNDGIEVQKAARDENDQCSRTNYAETSCKDLNVLTTNSPTLSTNKRKGFQIPSNQEVSLGASPRGSPLSNDSSQTSECNYYKQGVKCFNSELYDADTEEAEISSSILHLNCDASSEDKAMSCQYCSDAEEQSTMASYRNQISIQDGISTPTISNEKTEQSKSAAIEESQQQTKELEAESSTEENLNNCHNEFQLRCKSDRKDLVGMFKEKLLQNTSVQFSHLSAEQDSIPTIKESINDNKTNNGATGQTIKSPCTDGSQSTSLNPQDLQAVENMQKLVVQAHCEHLEDILALFEKEEYLLNKLATLDFKDYVTQLEEILMQKSKCIQRMQGQIHKYQIHTGTVCDNSITKSSVS